MAGFELKSHQFRREREESWRELEELCRRVERSGLRRLSADELRRLPLLYRGAASSLSVARAISLDRNLLEYLEHLVGRAYIAVYTAKQPAWAAVRAFAVSFPTEVRRHAGHLAVATALMLLGVLAGFLLVADDPERFYAIMPAGLADGRTPDATTDDLRAALYTDDDDGDEPGVESLNFFATFLFTHNAKIGILSFALGFAAGAPVVYLMFYNGLILGALASVYHARGLGAEFWAWVLPHGVTELGAVCLCGAAGLVLGMAVVFPGDDTRVHNLARHGRRAAVLVIGAVLMLFLAALIEGFFRQLVNDVPARWAVAAATTAGWIAYVALAGRRRGR